VKDRVTPTLMSQETGVQEAGNSDGIPFSLRFSLRWVGSLLVLAGLLALALFGFLQPKADGYTHEVLALTGDPAKGRAIFVMNCVACHGQWADGEVGPSLRGVGEKLSPQQLVHQVVSGQTPPMPQFQPSPQEMADLLSYLRKL